MCGSGRTLFLHQSGPSLLPRILSAGSGQRRRATARETIQEAERRGVRPGSSAVTASKASRIDMSRAFDTLRIECRGPRIVEGGSETKKTASGSPAIAALRRGCDAAARRPHAGVVLAHGYLRPFRTVPTLGAASL